MHSSTNPACPLCGAGARMIRHAYLGYRAPETYDIHTCDYCDLQFASPFRSEGVIYDVIYQAPDRFSGYERYNAYKESVLAAPRPLAFLASSEPMYWFVAQAVQARPPSHDEAILEVGCGMGYLTYSLNKAGYRVRGLDISENAVARAKEAFGDLYIRADIRAFADTEPNSVDTVIMTEVLEHLDTPLAVMQAIYDCLKPGGRALISTPSKDFYPPGAIWRTDSPPVHLAWYSQTSLREIARKLGFTISFQDFTPYNEGKILGLDAPRDLASYNGVHRVSAENTPLETSASPASRGSFSLKQVAPSLKRLTQRRKFTRRAVEHYAAQTEVLGAIFQKPSLSA